MVGAMVAVATMLWALRTEPQCPDVASGARHLESLTPQDARPSAEVLQPVGAMARPALADPASSDPSAVAREEATLALGDRLDAASGAALASALLDRDASVQSAAIRGLARIADDSAAAALSPLLQHAQRRLRFEALDALGQMDNATAHALLTAASLDSDPVMAEAAREWLDERRRATRNSN
jgi:HEAT repeat protein